MGRPSFKRSNFSLDVDVKPLLAGWLRRAKQMAGRVGIENSGGTIFNLNRVCIWWYSRTID